MTLLRASNFSVLAAVALLCSLPSLSCEVVPHGDQVDFIPLVYMRITNLLGEVIPLSIHCQSRDRDFGSKVLSFHAYTAWEFRPSYISKTALFWCSMEWKTASGSRINATFDVYREKGDSKRCATECLWSIEVDGAWVYDQERKKYVLGYSWW